MFVAYEQIKGISGVARGGGAISSGKHGFLLPVFGLVFILLWVSATFVYVGVERDNKGC